MKKMKLNLDELAVDSFDTSANEKPRGTVFGEQCTCHTACTCPGCPTCAASCNGTCYEATCNTCAGQWTCDYSCDSCQYTQCANSCFGCPTVSGGVCECWA
ncbi:MAG TPA: hypothetical protein VK358_12505 [Longimicrobium sp.]|nr:hypothetical protein [Longimicrobium sp.]